MLWLFYALPSFMGWGLFCFVTDHNPPDWSEQHWTTVLCFFLLCFGLGLEQYFSQTHLTQKEDDDVPLSLLFFSGISPASSPFLGLQQSGGPEEFFMWIFSLLVISKGASSTTIQLSVSLEHNIITFTILSLHFKYKSHRSPFFPKLFISFYALNSCKIA